MGKGDKASAEKLLGNCTFMLTVISLVLTALFAALTAVGAFFKIPFALAAISLQFLFTAMAGILLGAGYGALSQLVYVLIGLVGVKIFELAVSF